MSNNRSSETVPPSRDKALHTPRTFARVTLRPFARMTLRPFMLMSRRAARVLASVAFTLLAVEFLDELVDGARQASWAMVRADLALTYAQVGLLLTLPKLFANAVEPALNILGDTRRRRALILGGGACFVLALALVASSRGFWSLLLAFVVFNPASGAFVGLSQASLMDRDEARREQNMARWVFAGSLGVVAGALAVGACAATGAGWRACFGAMSLVALLVLLLARRLPLGTRVNNDQERHAQESQRDGSTDNQKQRIDTQERRMDDQEPHADDQKRRAEANFVEGNLEELSFVEDAQAELSFVEGVRGALRALRRAEVWRWLALLEVADLMLDGFRGYLALYFADVVGASEARAGVAVAVCACAGLAGDFLLIPLLERVRGLKYLRLSALAMLLLLPAFLVAPGTSAKLLLLVAIGVCSAGWYSILKAQLYAALPGRSGAALALSNLSGFAGALIPLALGLFAERFGLGAAMWLLLLSPLALIVALPRETKFRASC
jgi:FSR family fosmidomycin resistance protein-like MFS transporter